MTPHRIEGGYSACGGRIAGSWYAGILVLEDADLKRYEAGTPDGFAERVERCRLWQPRLVNRPRRIVLVQPAAAGLDQRELAAAERIDGPACPGEPVDTPTLAWTERTRGRWHLKLYEHGSPKTVCTQDRMLLHPRIAATRDGLVLACERNRDDGTPEVILLRPDGQCLGAVPGSHPRLAATAGGVALLTEQITRDAIALRLTRFAGGAPAGAQTLAGGDYTFNADLAWSGEGDALYVAAECSPSFGENSQRGSHREIRVWRCRGGDPEPMGSDTGPSLPVEPRALQSLGPENLPPIRPQLIVEDGEPAVVFRQFRYHGFKTFGWDVFWCRRERGAWAPPVRLSPCLVLPDTGLGVLPLGNRYVGLFPALENDGSTSRSYDHRLEIVGFERDQALERFEIPPDKRGAYGIPRSYRDIAPEPPALPAPCPGRTLLWGDLHMHSTYSKCVAAADGSPEENLRFARHVLGCRVFTLTEHTNALSGPEITWCLDQLEKAAGDDGVVLYGTEPGHTTEHHTNWYTHDRDAFERLEVALSSHRKDRLLEYRHAREEFAAGSVIALRHFHGRRATPEELRLSFEPLLEVAMEAMQGRCNALLAPAENTPRFPTSFLNLGCKLGIVGGTDHFRSGPNHFCLTGFWVREVSARGVWEAIRSRHTFGMSNARIAMAATLNDQPMGSAVTLPTAAPVRIVLQAACGRPIRRAALLRDGEPLPWVEVGTPAATLELVDPAPPPGYHWYIPTVEVDTAFGADRPGYGHTSPFFVSVREGQG